MSTQEERSKGIFNLLLMATQLLKEDTNQDKNFETVQNLVRQAFFKYLDLADCPFRDTCLAEAKANGYVRGDDD